MRYIASVHRAYVQLIVNVEEVGGTLINGHTTLVTAIRNAIALINPDIDVRRVRISIREMDEDTTPLDRW